MKPAPIGVFGGTFNPIHLGHIRSALELLDCLSMAEIRLMPAAQPPHRSEPELTPERRARLVVLAIQNTAGLSCDERELRRSGPSYTIDSLIELRSELGPERSIVLTTGVDALNHLEQWHRWRELLAFAHIVVLERPGFILDISAAVADWLETYSTGDSKLLHSQPAGSVLRLTLTQHPISATDIRRKLALGESVEGLVSAEVWTEIQNENLYHHQTRDTRGA